MTSNEKVLKKAFCSLYSLEIEFTKFSYER